MNRSWLVALALAMATPAAAQQAATTEEAPPERQTSPDGRLQQLDAYGNPLFDAEGNPIWEATPEEKALQAYEEALVLHRGIQGQQPDLFNAASKLTEAVNNNPNFREAWFNLGIVQLEQNLVKDAQRTLQRAADLDPKSVETWLALGIAFERDGMFTAADNAYAKGLSVENENVALLNGVARLMRKRGKFDEAASRARAILKINSNSLDAYNTLGLSYLATNQYELADFVLMKAEASVPGGDKSASIAANRGLVFFRQGQEFEAEEQFTRAQALDPKHPGASVNLAHLKLKNLDFQGALTLLETAHRVLPASIPVQLNLAVARRGTGDLSGAKSMLEGIVAADGEYAGDALLNLGILYGDFLKNQDAAIDIYREYIAKREDAGDVLAEDAPVRDYLKEAEKQKRREDKRRQKDAKKAAKEAAKAAAAAEEAAAAATQPAPQPVEQPAEQPVEQPAEQPPEPAPADPAPANDPAPAPTGDPQ